MAKNAEIILMQNFEVYEIVITKKSSYISCEYVNICCTGNSYCYGMWCHHVYKSIFPILGEIHEAFNFN